MATSPSDPSPEELAAIVAAVEMAWPRPVVAVSDDGGRPPAWRFSGRWWVAPVVSFFMAMVQPPSFGAAAIETVTVSPLLTGSGTVRGPAGSISIQAS